MKQPFFYRYIQFGLFGVPLAVLLLPIALLEARTTQYQARAYELGTGKFLYTEQHREVWQNGRHQYSEIQYRSPDGKVIARKKVDFSRARTAPDFRMTDFRIGMQEGATRRAGKIETFGRSSKAEAVEKAVVPISNPLVVDSGFHYFIRDNWNRLLGGSRVDLNFLVPLRGDAYRFYMQKVAEDANTVTFRMRISSRLLAVFAEPVDAVYDRKLQRLVEYRGLSNIKGEDGENYRARIVFQY